MKDVTKKAVADMMELMPCNELNDKIDRAQAFLLYTQFGGDLHKVAKALSVPAIDIARCAAVENWEVRWGAFNNPSQSDTPQEAERKINRVYNFVQAHRLRIVLERLLARFHKMDDQELFEACCSKIVKKDKDGNETVELKIVSRPFADLASALEKVHVMTYLALLDTTTERKVRAEKAEQSGPSSTEIHAALAKAMAEVTTSNTPQALIVDAKLAIAEEQRREGKDTMAQQVGEQVMDNISTSKPTGHPSGHHI